MKVAIVIVRELTGEEISAINRLLLKNPGSTVYSNKKHPDSLMVKNPKSFELDPTEKSNINYQVMDKLLAFGEKTVEGKAITDHLMFGNVSLWHYHKFRIYFNVRNFIYNQTLIENVSADFDKVFYYGDDEISFCKSESEKKVIQKFIQNKAAKKSYSSLFKYLIFFILRIFTGLFYLGNLKGKKHLLVDHSRKQTCLDLNTLKPKNDNYNLSYLFEKAGDDFVILDEIEIIKPGSKSEGLFKGYNFFKKRKRKYFFNEYILLEELFSKNSLKKRKDDNENLNKIYQLFKKQITKPVDQLILDNLISLHGSSLFYLLKYRAYQRFFSKHYFQTVTTIDENSPRIKSILDAAKSREIKTIGIQHGTIHKLHPAYMFTPQDKKRKVVPDFTFVWGKYWKNFLLDKGNYPENSIKIAGQIRTDIIPKLIANQELIKKFVNYPAGKKIILFASQPQRDPDLRWRAAYDVFVSAKEIGGAHLVIKLHPAEKYDYSYYHQIAREAGYKEYTIIYKTELYALIASADVVVTCFSTVGAEATYFFKPLVILDHLLQDIQQYYKEGIAFQAKNSDELIFITKRLLSGEIRLDKNAYEKYIHRFAYKIDGKVAERILGFINNL